MIFKNFKKLLGEKETAPTEEEFYTLSTEDALKGLASEGTKLILLEPRAFSESQQIADHLKNRHTVIVNLRRVTTDQAKRIVDFLTGTIYAIGGDLQKIGGGIFLCAPRNMSVQGKMAEDDIKDKIHDNSDIDVEIK